MKVGINLMLWTFHPRFIEHEPLLDKVKEIGFDAFEVVIAELDDAEIQEFAKKALGLQLEPQCLDLFLATESDLIGLDPGMRDKAVDRIKAGISKTRDMGAKVFSGPFFQGLCGSTSVGPTKQ